MKIGIVTGKRTQELYAYLALHCRNTADISIILPNEAPSHLNHDIYLLESPVQPLLTSLLSLEKQPLIVILQNSTSTETIRYCPDYKKQLLKLLDSFEDNEPLLALFEDHQKYLYPQNQIVLLKQEHSTNLVLRSGQTILCSEPFHRIASRLSPRLFFCAGETIYLNSLMVLKFEPDAIVMQNEMIIPIRSEQMQSVQNAYYKTKYYQNRTNHAIL